MRWTKASVMDQIELLFCLSSVNVNKDHVLIFGRDLFYPVYPNMDSPNSRCCKNHGACVLVYISRFKPHAQFKIHQSWNIFTWCCLSFVLFGLSGDPPVFLLWPGYQVISPQKNPHKRCQRPQRPPAFGHPGGRARSLRPQWPPYCSHPRCQGWGLSRPKAQVAPHTNPTWPLGGCPSPDGPLHVSCSAFCNQTKKYGNDKSKKTIKNDHLIIQQHVS